jgi:hypothetical protein
VNKLCSILQNNQFISSCSKIIAHICESPLSCAIIHLLRLSYSWIWQHRTIIPATQETEVGGSQIQGQPEESYWNPVPKPNSNKRDGGLAQVATLLPSMGPWLQYQVPQKNGLYISKSLNIGKNWSRKSFWQYWTRDTLKQPWTRSGKTSERWAMLRRGRDWRSIY